jgi:UDP-4-amino-4,6-dideoxy-N-acetyl-beta-L-altrosamine N-acetyltransferase
LSRFVLRPVCDSEVETIYRWRNEPRVRQVMPYSAEIDLEAHRLWWPLAMRDPARRMLILEDREIPVAVVVFLDVRQGISAKWGCYTAPRQEITKAKSLTAWVTCQVAAIAYAFDVLHLEILYCETLKTHTPVLRLSDRVGFETIDEKPPFILKKLLRASYEGRQRPSSPLFKRLAELAIKPDPRDVSTKSPFPGPGHLGMPSRTLGARPRAHE